jgi:ParB-like chromosome segregation protein Spo0J
MPDVVNRTVPVGACKPHPGNYNRHDEGQIADLRLSLQKFGQVRSIVVQDDGAGGYLLVAGHGLHAAAAAEGLTELRADVIPADWLPVKVIAYLAADNELARRGSPDEAQLAALVRQIEEEADAELARLAAGGEERLALLLGELPSGDEWADAMGSLPDGDKSPFQQMTFTLHDTQAEQVKAALAAAKAAGAFVDSPNENSNGNALARICETYVTEHGR